EHGEPKLHGGVILYRVRRRTPSLAAARGVFLINSRLRRKDERGAESSTPRSGVAIDTYSKINGRGCFLSRGSLSSPVRIRALSGPRCAGRDRSAFALGRRTGRTRWCRSRIQRAPFPVPESAGESAENRRFRLQDRGIRCRYSATD